MNTNLRVATLPVAIVPADKEANLDAVEKALEKLPEGTDIVVLPELFSTGYTEDSDVLHMLAERNTGATIDRVKEWAARTGAAFAGSYLAITHPRIYNRGFFIEPSGEETFYDKHHLFSLSKEPQLFAAGTERPLIVRFRGWNISLVVCYDLRFPVWCRSRKGDYDLMLVVANWPKARGYAWEHLLIARAIENQSCVVGANRGGNDAYGDYDGMSYIFDSRGMAVGVQPADSPFIVADLDGARLESFRRKFPFQFDADDFSLK
ncbi:MAG: nitrilase family protein [Muribaculaceae bacterium]|nr:nitrilase family protein [Muribaculaceae bacterium]